MGRFRDLTNQRFGKWIVLRRAPNRGRRTYWFCRCECGIEKEVEYGSLVKGGSTNCGCSITYENRHYRIKDLTGKRFGRLVVLCRGKRKEKNKSIFWLCRCDCGREIEIEGSNLIRGTTKSCGCYREELRSSRAKVDFGLATKNQVYNVYKHNAKKRNILFELSFEQFIDLTQKNCHYCDSGLSNIQKNYFNNGDFLYNGIDRVDNTKGYIIENCVPCCWNCGRAKNNLSYNEFINWGKRLGKYLIQMEENNESNRIPGARERANASSPNSFFC